MSLLEIKWPNWRIQLHGVNRYNLFLLFTFCSSVLPFISSLCPHLYAYAELLSFYQSSLLLFPLPTAPNHQLTDTATLHIQPSLCPTVHCALIIDLLTLPHCIKPSHIPSAHCNDHLLTDTVTLYIQSSLCPSAYCTDH